MDLLERHLTAESAEDAEERTFGVARNKHSSLRNLLAVKAVNHSKRIIDSRSPLLFSASSAVGVFFLGQGAA
jgi:hypothetical protein